MELSCTQENLRNALTLLERVVGRQGGTLPILSNILLETKEGQLSLSGTNLEIGVTTRIGAKINTEGQMVIPAKVFSNFIQNIRDDQIVTIKETGRQIIVESGNHLIRINGLDGKDFPIIPTYSGDKKLILPPSEFREGIQKVLFAVSLNESRPELTGIYFALQEGEIVLTATDSFRLAEWTHKLISPPTIQDFSVIVPTDTFQEVLRVSEREKGEVCISFQDNQIFFEIGETHILSRLINGRFPEYQAIIPKQYTLVVEFLSAELQQALKMAHSFSSASGEVQLVFGDEQMVELSTLSQGVGEQVTHISYRGAVEQGFKIVFHPRHLLDGIAPQLGERIILSLNSPTTPVRVSSSETDRYTYIIMPIRK